MRLAMSWTVRGSNPGGGWDLSTPVHTSPGAHPAFCTTGTGSFPGVKCGRGVMLTPHPLLVPWSWKSRAIPLLTLWAVRPVQSLSDCTGVHFTGNLNASRFPHHKLVSFSCNFSHICTHDKVLHFIFYIWNGKESLYVRLWQGQYCSTFIPFRVLPIARLKQTKIFLNFLLQFVLEYNKIQFGTNSTMY